MIGPDQDLSDFPPWIWPYINVAGIAKGSRATEEVSLGVSLPNSVVALHVTQIVTAAMFRQLALKLSDSRLQGEMEKAASGLMLQAIDDCGNGRPKPWPRPPRRHQLLQIAANVAIAAVETADEGLSASLVDAVGQLEARAGEA